MNCPICNGDHIPADCPEAMDEGELKRLYANLLLEVYAELKITRMGYGSEKEFFRLGDKIAKTVKWK